MSQFDFSQRRQLEQLRLNFLKAYEQFAKPNPVNQELIRPFTSVSKRQLIEQSPMEVEDEVGGIQEEEGDIDETIQLNLQQLLQSEVNSPRNSDDASEEELKINDIG